MDGLSGGGEKVDAAVDLIVGGEKVDSGSGDEGFAVIEGVGNFGASSSLGSVLCCLALARSVIQEGCEGGGGVGFGFSSVFVIFDSSQLDFVGLHRFDGLGGDAISGRLSSTTSALLFREIIDLDRLCRAGEDLPGLISLSSSTVTVWLL
jgi:hypothetical protein